MDDTEGSIFDDAWMRARVGNAIDVLVDRTLNRPQYMSDAGQAYGVDANGNLYQLGQTNSQIVAQVQTSANRNSNMTLVLIAGIIALVLMESK